MSTPSSPTSTSSQDAAPPAADVAVARKILEGNAGVIAVVPAGAEVDTWALLVRLARAMRYMGRGSVALVRSPDLEAPPRSGGGRAGPGDAFRILDLAADGSLAELVLPAAIGLAESASHLTRAIERASGMYAHLLLGFAGYIPDVREALQVPDAFVTAARAGHTKEVDLSALVQQLPPSRHLGTLLVD